MKNMLKLIIFLIYTLMIFFTKNYIILLVVFIINITLMIILKVSLKKAIINLFKISIFIILTIVINSFILSLYDGILLGIRLILVCNATYTFSKVLSYTQFAEAIEILIYPLKIFKVKSKDVSLMICMAIAFIPIFKNQLQQIKNVLQVKAAKNNKYIFKPFFISIFQRLNEIEMSIKAKAYTE